MCCTNLINVKDIEISPELRRSIDQDPRFNGGFENTNLIKDSLKNHNSFFSKFIKKVDMHERKKMLKEVVDQAPKLSLKVFLIILSIVLTFPKIL